ncbi:MAG TPA: peptide chain release factor 1 [Bacteroidales bacterium]|nr:peptide chain release factor 1 [Bacteroidales bacterium]
MKQNTILNKLKGVKTRHEEVQKLLTDPSVTADMDKFIKLNKEYKDLEPVIEAYDEYLEIINGIEDAKELMNADDPDMQEMAKAEFEELSAKQEPMEEKIKFLLIPKDPEDEKNAILEIRAGSGGDEASIFAGDLYRMYTKFCESKNWKMEVTRITEGTQGGYKEIVATVSGEGVYGILKYESGVHRVQRVPQTETQGRVHTSAASVAVLPEAEEVDIKLDPADIKRDEFCSSGPGGQSVNTTYSAIRLTHIPTGLVVTCQDEKSKLKNLDKAMKELRTRLYNLEHQKYLDDIASKRKTMVSSGDRSAKIRTYNFPQGRVTDHRINLTVYNLQEIMNGNISEIIDKLIMEENAARLKSETTEDES